ncbi:MAG: S41 family peptidase, partial [Anaerolineae bacterium]|nr:S41 family peptidase [Anaerolineae bacterium]
KIQGPFSFRTAGEVFQEELWYTYMDVIQNTYLSGDYVSCCQDMIFYGKLNDATGYIAVLKEDYYTNKSGDVPIEGLAVLNQALDEMTAYFAGVPNLIIDARFNWGGTDGYSLAIASRFTDRQDMAAYQTARGGTSQVNYQEFFYNPDAGPAFDAKNVYVLAGPATLSAGECIALYLGNLEKVTVVGEKTMGVWSNTLIRHLPNGWEFTLSNERIFDPNGNNYEAVGYPPDVVVDFNAPGFEVRTDAVLDKTLELIADQNSN